MGKQSHVVKDRTCLVCGHTIPNLTSKELRDHAKACKGKRGVKL